METIIATTSLILLLFLLVTYIIRRYRPVFGSKKIVIKAGTTSDFELLLFIATKLETQGHIEKLEVDRKGKKVEFYTEKYPVWDSDDFDPSTPFGGGAPAGDVSYGFQRYREHMMQQGEKTTRFSPHSGIF